MRCTDKRKTVVMHMGDRIVPFYTSVIKLVHPEETNLPAVGPQQLPPVPRDIVSALEQLQSQYRNLPERIIDRVSEESNAFLSSASAASEINRLFEQGASSDFETVVVHDRKDPRFAEAKIAEIEQLVKKERMSPLKKTTLL